MSGAPSFALRDFAAQDASAVNALAVAAFTQYQHAYTDWPIFRERIADMAALAAGGEIIVARAGADIVGAVAYIGPGKPKSAIFLPEWPIMLMLEVAPRARGLGVGRALALACLERARRDGAEVFALHTSELMTVALPMYERMGFTWSSAVPDIHGVAYKLYLKRLDG
ncbi:GNAT family N-acetyltransferase [Massilia glaciei]|uniref:N-acetyltransferase n=1 Tax=Massilia glaciei TaxID=1524097 RepID=A0A2U2HH66_9BURK|nr:GNAT family N-acetyltransferase [Massilia glaciei]PWF44997.1 N-acetyltransferase [Massilia glaciei]